MQIIPLRPEPSQNLSIVLSGQNCDISVYTLSTGLYFDLASNGVQICSTRLCVNAVDIIRNKSTGFIGDFAFIDMVGIDNPNYTELGTRYLLVYQ